MQATALYATEAQVRAALAAVPVFDAIKGHGGVFFPFLGLIYFV